MKNVKLKDTLRNIVKEEVAKAVKEAQGSYTPGSSDTDGWDNGVYIDIKTRLTPDQQKMVIAKTEEYFDGGKIVPGRGGKLQLFVPFGGDYANAIAALRSLKIK
jgi:hypothetical protein